MAAKNPNPKTLFHLQPWDDFTRLAVLGCPENRKFVSQTTEGDSGLEIGFHVPTPARGRTITRLGRRNADLILPHSRISSVHVAFEVHPDTLAVLLSVRSKQTWSVKIAPLAKGRTTTGKPIVEAEAKPDAPVSPLTGDCVVLYGQNYLVAIGPYSFFLLWRNLAVEELRALAEQCYNESLQRMRLLAPSDQTTEMDQSELLSYHITRLHSVKEPIFCEIKNLRVKIGSGSFGTVFRTVDQTTGLPIVLKEVDLAAQGDVEQARAYLHREVKAMASLSHEHIIEYLGTGAWDTPYPHILMPLRDGNLSMLANSSESLCDAKELSRQALRQILRALDCLASHRLCHRDVKPDNILYTDLGQGNYRFQLADFGLVNHQSLAVTRCGTSLYSAPEIYPEYGTYPQSPKMDVWSLLVTILAIYPDCSFPPQNARRYDDILQAVRTEKTKIPELLAMARENPNSRASAAQMLVALFGGQGLTTPMADVPPLDAEVDEPSSAGYSRPYTRARPPTRQRPIEPRPPPLIIYPVPAKRPRRAVQARAEPRHVIPPRPLPRKGQEAGPGQHGTPMLRPAKVQKNDGIAKRHVALPVVRVDVVPASTLHQESANRDHRDHQETVLQMPGGFPAG